MKIFIRLDDLSSGEAQSIVREHMAGMLDNSPIESVHALPLEKLCQPNVSFWTAWIGSELCGCGALQMLGPHHGEIKTMRTRARFLRQGVGQSVLTHIVNEAQARAMYEKNGFEICEPFGDYQLDPHSVFMSKAL